VSIIDKLEGIDFSALVVKPNQVLVINVHGDVSHEQAYEMRRIFARHGLRDRVIITANCDLAVVDKQVES